MMTGMKRASLVASYIAVVGFVGLGGLGACGGSSGDDGDDVPVIQGVSNASATNDPDGTDFDVTFDVDFADSDSGGEDASAYTFTTTNLGTNVDDQQVALSPPAPSPITITTTIPMADDGGDASVDCTVALFDSDGAGTAFDFTLTVSTSSKPTIVVHRKGATQALGR
jgi:hypothetical protein